MTAKRDRSSGDTPDFRFLHAADPLETAADLDTRAEQDTAAEPDTAANPDTAAEQGWSPENQSADATPDHVAETITDSGPLSDAPVPNAPATSHSQAAAAGSVQPASQPPPTTSRPSGKVQASRKSTAVGAAEGAVSMAAVDSASSGGGRSGLTLSGPRATYLITYAAALTLLLIILLATGRLSLWGPHPLESLPDIRPLDSQEFRKVPPDAAVPPGHVLHLGEERRFGDVVVRPLKVTREPLRFVGFLNRQENPELTSGPVLKLWLEFRNMAANYAFPPCDAYLMAWRSPVDGVDESVAANTWLQVTSAAGSSPRRVLNFLHSPHSNFIMADQNAGTSVAPGESVVQFVASSEDIGSVPASANNQYTWRVHLRKGVHLPSGHGVTTLVDVLFQEADIQSPTDSPSGPATAASSG